MPCTFVFQIIPINKTCPETAEDSIKRITPFFHQKVNVVRHQTPCIQLKPADFSVMVEKEKKSVIVLFLFKNTLPVNSAQYNMINTRITFLPCSSWHKHHPLQNNRLSLRCKHGEPSLVFPTGMTATMIVMTGMTATISMITTMLTGSISTESEN